VQFPGRALGSRWLYAGVALCRRLLCSGLSLVRSYSRRSGSTGASWQAAETRSSNRAPQDPGTIPDAHLCRMRR
jgi:hypothetical protein